MRNKFTIVGIIFILTTFSLMSMVYSIITFTYNSALEKKIDEKDEILREVLLKDSIHQITIKEYADKIDKYVSDCTYEIDGKTYSSAELIEYVNGSFNQHRLVKDSLNQYINTSNFYQKDRDKCYTELSGVHDSLNIYRAIVKRHQNEYNIRSYVKIKDNKMTISTPFNRVDSAMMVFKHYKHKLSQNADGTWSIILDK